MDRQQGREALMNSLLFIGERVKQALFFLEANEVAKSNLRFCFYPMKHPEEGSLRSDNPQIRVFGKL